MNYILLLFFIILGLVSTKGEDLFGGMQNLSAEKKPKTRPPVAQKITGNDAISTFRADVLRNQINQNNNAGFVGSKKKKEVDITKAIAAVPTKIVSNKNLIQKVDLGISKRKKIRPQVNFSKIGTALMAHEFVIAEKFEIVVKTPLSHQIPTIDGDEFKLIWEIGPLKQYFKNDIKTLEYLKTKLSMANSILKHYIKIAKGTPRGVNIREGEYCDGYFPKAVTYDAHLVVITKMIDEDDSTIAQASACRQDPKTNRSTVGVMEINLTFVNTNEQSVFSQLNYLMTFVHEVLHIISFSKSLKDVMTHRTNKISPAMTMVEKASSQVWRQDHHWDETFIPNELMNPYSRASRVLSIFTLEQIESFSSSYVIDKSVIANNMVMDLIDDYPSFLNYKCAEKDKASKYPFFCSPQQQAVNFGSCTVDYLWKAFCSREVKLANNCAPLAALSTGFCLDSLYDPQYLLKNGKEPKYEFEHYGQSSRCFETNKNVPVCLKFEFEKDNLFFYIGKERHKCTKDLEEVPFTFQNTTGKKLTFALSIRCPRISYFKDNITKTNCPNYCSGRGFCSDAKCICFGDFFGDSCENLKSKVDDAALFTHEGLNVN